MSIFIICGFFGGSKQILIQMSLNTQMLMMNYSRLKKKEDIHVLIGLTFLGLIFKKLVQSKCNPLMVVTKHVQTLLMDEQTERKQMSPLEGKGDSFIVPHHEQTIQHYM